MLLLRAATDHLLCKGTPNYVHRCMVRGKRSVTQEGDPGHVTNKDITGSRKQLLTDSTEPLNTCKLKGNSPAIHTQRMLPASLLLYVNNGAAQV
jgi:hypothetical protein